MKYTELAKKYFEKHKSENMFGEHKAIITAWLNGFAKYLNDLPVRKGLSIKEVLDLIGEDAGEEEGYVSRVIKNGLRAELRTKLEKLKL